MRVAMGPGIREIDREGRAIEFYRLLSSVDFMSSTPTLFNAGTTRPQLSSRYLTTVADDLDDIFQGIKHNALLAKYSGGLGNDWTPVRGIGSHIMGINGLSSVVVPFLKIANDTAVAANPGWQTQGRGLRVHRVLVRARRLGLPGPGVRVSGPTAVATAAAGWLARSIARLVGELPCWQVISHHQPTSRDAELISCAERTCHGPGPRCRPGR